MQLFGRETSLHEPIECLDDDLRLDSGHGLVILESAAPRKISQRTTTLGLHQ